jgi:large subunit ribosomal protein L13
MEHRQKTFMAKRSDRPVRWFLVDAQGKTLGRFATEIANILRGKHSPDYTPHADMGDGVIIVNAEKIQVTGSKEARKVYHRYTGYRGGLRTTTYREMLEEKPEEILRHAVRGMVPATRQGRAQLKRLRIYAGEGHNLDAQKPIKVNV